MSSGNHLRRSPTWRPVGLPGLRRLTVRAGDRRRHRRQEQIAAVAGIRSAVHRTAGRARPLDGEVTRRGCLAELASRRRRGAGRPGRVAVTVWLGTQLRARSRPQGRRETAPRRAAAPSGEGGEVAVLGEVDQAGLHGSLQRHSVPARRFARPRDSPGRMV